MALEVRQSAEGMGGSGWLHGDRSREGEKERGDVPMRVDVAEEREDGGGSLRLRAHAGWPAPQRLVPAHRRRQEKHQKHEAGGQGPPRSHVWEEGRSKDGRGLEAGEAASCLLPLFFLLNFFSLSSAVMTQRKGGENLW